MHRIIPGCHIDLVSKQLFPPEGVAAHPPSISARATKHQTSGGFAGHFRCAGSRVVNTSWLVQPCRTSLVATGLLFVPRPQEVHARQGHKVGLYTPTILGGNSYLSWLYDGGGGGAVKDPTHTGTIKWLSQAINRRPIRKLPVKLC